MSHKTENCQKWRYLHYASRGPNRLRHYPRCQTKLVSPGLHTSRGARLCSDRVGSTTLDSTMALLRLLFVLALALFVSADQLRILHRLSHPSLEDKNFFERGTLSLDPFGASSFEAAQHLDDDLQAFASIAQPLPDALYQVAFAPADPDAPWDVSSVKAVRALSSVLRLRPVLTCRSRTSVLPPD